MLDSWYDTLANVGEFSLLGAVVVGGSLWLWKQNHHGTPTPDDMIINREAVEKAIAQTNIIINQLAQESVNHPAITTFKEEVVQLPLELNRQELNIAVTGGKSVGKSKVIQNLHDVEINKSWHFQETASLFTDLQENCELATLLTMQKSDFVLFLTNGDLTDSEFKVWEQLQKTKQSTLLVFNKQDQYMIDERATILQSLKGRVGNNVVSIAADPVPVKVRKYNDDTTVQEWIEKPSSDMQQLTEQLSIICTEQREQLVCKTTMRKVLLLKNAAKNSLNQVRSDRANPIIEQYQWIAAAAAFANPIPALDILATAAITGQMVMDLGNIYQQKFSLEQAQTIAGTMGTSMAKLGLVELSTRAVTGILKTNAITFIAGGLVEGVSAAYLTRIAGLSLVAYFEQQEIAIATGNGLNLEQLKGILQNVFQQNQKLAVLETFVKQSVKRLLPETKTVEVVS
ncbi:DUF697 domain-containing protein [Anabaena sp. FACHB-1237]|nr:DUF697 domain-containing protein [Anabaena sp. FACHB-1237]